MILKDNESKNYVGGGKVAIAIGIVLGAIVSFALGFVDGYSNPSACRVK